MSARSRIAGLVAGLAALVSSGNALACINVHVAPSVQSAGPDTTVGFTISTLVSGAQYTVSVEGHAVATGVAAGDYVSGSFSMPNLGSTSFTATLTAVVAHDDLEQSPWVTTAPLAYVAPAAAAPTPVTSPSSRPSTAAPPPPRHSAPAHSALAKRVPTAPAQPVHAPAVGHRPSRAPAELGAPSVTSRPAAATRPTARAPGRHRVRRLDGPRVGARTIPKRELRDPTQPSLHARVLTVRAPARTHWPLALMLLFLACVAPAAAYWLRRRTPRPRPPDAIEAELQEIIAEERARALEASRTPRSG